MADLERKNWYMFILNLYVQNLYFLQWRLIVNKKYIGLMGAALLAIATISSNSSSVKAAATTETHSALVKVDENTHELNKLLYENESWGEDYPDPSAIKIEFKHIPTLKITKSTLNNPTSLTKKLKKVASNYGTIKSYDVFLTDVYKKDTKGKLVPTEVKKLRAGDKGEVAIVANLKNLNPGTKYTFLDLSWPGDDMIWTSERASEKGTLSDSAYPVVRIPFQIKSSSKTSKINKHISIKGKANHKVKTYNSNGKALKKYVYANHTYKVNRKKTIHGKTYYKIYGKNQWVPSNKVTLKK